jgi:predicted alpha/beta superfamily hydrolase
MELQPLIPTLSGGARQRILVTPQVIAPRNIDVWLPPGYAEPGRCFPVLYMHDGQNIFDPSEAYGGQSWEMDCALEVLIAAGETSGAIIVGVWNSGDGRWGDYAPQKPLEPLLATPHAAPFLERAGGPPTSDAYLAFLVYELKPFIDATYPTLPDQSNTLVMGSSMGGLISLYAVEQYPDVFGGAGCVSTHWPAGGPDLVDALGAALPPAGRHRLYFDFGTTGLDAEYEPLQQRMDMHLRAAGYQEGQDWRTLKFPGADHNEPAWRRRVHVPLRFLLRG